MFCDIDIAKLNDIWQEIRFQSVEMRDLKRLSLWKQLIKDCSLSSVEFPVEEKDYEGLGPYDHRPMHFGYYNEDLGIYIISTDDLSEIFFPLAEVVIGFACTPPAKDRFLEKFNKAVWYVDGQVFKCKGLSSNKSIYFDYFSGGRKDKIIART